MTDDRSLATGLRSLADPAVEHPLWPPLVRGCPETSTADEPVALEVTYDYDEVDVALFERPPAPGHERWAPLLPPLSPATALGEGDTPLVEVPSVAAALDLDTEVYLKDESRNPTWSHKDRANRLMVSAALSAGAPGVVASTSGNHGAAAAAYAARAGLDSVILTAPSVPDAMHRFIASYGASLVCVEDNAERVALVDRLADAHGLHPVSSTTPVHTGHPCGPEGYKPIAYELVLQLDGAVPGAVFVPTGHGELLFGVYKGFRELERLGVTDGVPRMVGCEPATIGSLAAAVDAGEPVTTVDGDETAAVAIKGHTSSRRGYVAVTESDGVAQPVPEATFERAQSMLAASGLWQERSGAAGVAGLLAAVEDGLTLEGPIVCIGTSSGFKDGRRYRPPTATPATLLETIEDTYGHIL